MEPPLLEGLRESPVRFAGHIGFFSQRSVEDLFSQGDSVALLGRSDELWAYTVSDDPAELARLFERLVRKEGVRAFALLEEWMLPLLRPLGEASSELTCTRYYYPPDRPLPTRPDGIVTEPLTLDDVDTVCAESEYRAYISPEYIAAAITDGYSAGIREDGRLVAWGATHDDMAIGNLHVLPQFRRRRYAAAIVVALTGALVTEGFVPVMNIEPDNTGSRALAEKLGFLADRAITWIKLAP
jgi:8-oxo-dGTP diphosphatase